MDFPNRCQFVWYIVENTCCTGVFNSWSQELAQLVDSLFRFFPENYSLSLQSKTISHSMFSYFISTTRKRVLQTDRALALMCSVHYMEEKVASFYST